MALAARGTKLAVAAAGAVLHYLKDTQKSSLSHIDRLQFYEICESMALDATTVRNLELVQSLFDGSRQATLIGCLDRTSTGMGARLLKSWLLRPEIDLAEINARLDAVAELKQQLIEREEIKAPLQKVYDIETASIEGVAGDSQRARSGFTEKFAGTGSGDQDQAAVVSSVAPPRAERAG